jgi:cytoskeletal protein RodZ
MLKGYDDYNITAGDLLRGERATRGLTLPDVASKLNIAVEILKDIEDGILQDDRNNFFMDNVIRDYAIFMELNPYFIRDLYWQQVLDDQLVAEQHADGKDWKHGKILSAVRNLFSLSA